MKKTGRYDFRKPDRFAVYRHFDKQGNLLYIGSSGNVFRRTEEWRKCIWFRDIANISIEHFDCKETAMQAEAAAIKSERPKHNLTFNGQKD